MALDINTYNLKLTEIDRKIAEYKETPKMKAYYICLDKTGDSVFFGGNQFATANGFSCHSLRGQQGPLTALNKLLQQRTDLVAEMEKEQQNLKDQEILQQNALTEAANAKARQEEEKIRLLQEELLAGKQKTEQEKQKAAQQLQKAQQELAKAQLAAKLSQRGGEGDIAAGKTLLGTWESKGVNPWMIAGISVGALVVGVIIFKILR